jgi:hypothetical protein
MATVTVYKIEAYDIIADELRISRRMATVIGAAKMGGAAIKNTALDIDETLLESGEQWTARDFCPDAARKPV